jgi:hypothetical protein
MAKILPEELSGGYEKNNQMFFPKRRKFPLTNAQKCMLRKHRFFVLCLNPRNFSSRVILYEQTKT